MIKINNYAFNEDNITEIHGLENALNIHKRNASTVLIKDVTFDDIEWNYGNTNITPYIKIAKSIAEDLAAANIRIEELEEENKNLKEKLDNINISKNEAIKYIENEDEKLRLNLYYGKWAHNKLDEYDAIYLCEEIIKIRDYLLETLKRNENENIK